MAQIPTFSIFSAVSELIVTASVLYSIAKALQGKLPKLLMGLTLGFELCVNVLYMAGRASSADKSVELSQGLKLFYMGHGTLSLIMFIVLVAVYLMSLSSEADGKGNWFENHRTGTFILVGFWLVSVISGEGIFVVQYLIPALTGSAG